MTPDQEAQFLMFARERSPGLFRAALLLTGGDWQGSEDLTQETLGRMYQIWGRSHPIDQPAGALLRCGLPSGPRRPDVPGQPRRGPPDLRGPALAGRWGPTDRKDNRPAG